MVLAVQGLGIMKCMWSGFGGTCPTFSPNTIVSMSHVICIIVAIYEQWNICI